MSAVALDPSTIVAVLGAGTMGRGIARVAAQAGHDVLLYDSHAAAVTDAIDETRLRLDRDVERGRLATLEATAIAERISPCSRLDAAAPAGLVVEAIVEDLHTKIDVLRRLEDVLAPGSIIASNTSSLSITAIAAGLARPEHVAGMHFFNPAPVMPLVEVVAGAASSEATVDTLVQTALAWGKTPVRAASTPGFIVNRVARPFYGEGLRLLQEGVADHATIDAIVTGAGGFRMGPFTLMDLVGLDVNLAVSTSVYNQTFHDDRFAPNVIQQALVDAGYLGRKTGRGFYDYGEGASVVEPVTLPPVGLRVPVVGVVGDPGHASGLIDRLAAAGIAVATSEGHGHGFVVGETRVCPTDGRPATLIAAGADSGANVVVIDLVGDWATATTVAIAPAAQASRGAVEDATALMQAAGLEVALVGDSPGLVLMRIVAQLASIAADAVLVGVAEPEDVDTAMRLGTNYPRGPLEWADELGPATVVAVLDNLRSFYGEDRYRASVLLRQAALTGTAISTAGGT